MDVFPALSSDTRTQAHPRLRRQSSQTPATDGTDAGDTSLPPYAHARSLFVQLSDAAGTDANKAQLERTATPIVPRAAGQPPHMPLGVGQAVHRTRSISTGGPRPVKGSAQSLTNPLPAYRQTIGHAVRAPGPPSCSMHALSSCPPSLNNRQGISRGGAMLSC